MAITVSSHPIDVDGKQMPATSLKSAQVPDHDDRNPVIESAEYALKKTALVSINDQGVKAAAHHIYNRLRLESYTPRTWRTHPLHLLPPEPYAPTHPGTAACLNWIFFISSLNFSFWSDREGGEERYGVEWREGWTRGEEEDEVEGKGERATVVHTGYWSLVAAVDRALEEGIPITDPAFYASEVICPDALFEHVFRPASNCGETIPLLKERIAVLREVGAILCSRFGGSFQGFLDAFQSAHYGRGTALQLVKMVTETFPSFRDEIVYDGRKVYMWKRAQILVAETWAAFYPPPAPPASPATSSPPKHPLFPHGAAIHHLTMFADYRVPQIMHHLRILTYPPSLLASLRAKEGMAYGSREEVSIRAGSIVGVERVREEMVRLRAKERGVGGGEEEELSSVLIDFYLWDLAKRVESGREHVEGIETTEVVPSHRTRSIWY